MGWRQISIAFLTGLVIAYIILFLTNSVEVGGIIGILIELLILIWLERKEKFKDKQQETGANKNDSEYS